MQLKLAARLYIALVSLAGLAGLAWSFTRYRLAGNPAFWLLVASFVVVSALSNHYSLLLTHGARVHIDTIPLFAAILLFNPAVAGSIAGLGSLAGSLSRRVPLAEAAFNLGQTLAYTVTSGLVVSALATAPWTPAGWASWLALAAGALIMHCSNTGLVSGIVCLQSGQRLARVWAEGLRLNLVEHIVMFGLGLLAALVLAPYPWAIVLMALPATAVFTTLDRTLRMERQQQQLVEQLGIDIRERKQAEAARNEQQALAEALRDTAAALNSTLDFEQVLDRILENAGRVVPNDVANVMLIEEGSLSIARSRGYDRFGIRVSSTTRYRTREIDNLRQVVETSRPVIIQDTEKDPHWIHHFSPPITRCYLGVPILWRGQVIGVLNLGSQTVGFYQEQHAERLAAFADQAAMALENARLYRTEQEQNRRLQQSQTQLIHAEKMAALGRLVASIAHEINNPLQAVQTSLTLAEEEIEAQPRQDRLERYLRMAEDEIERVSDIVRRLRDFYRPARQEMQIADVHTLLKSVLQLFARQLQNNNVTVHLEWASDIPSIRANPDHLKQVFLNLVLNAIDAMSEKSPPGGSLTVRTAIDQIIPANNGQAGESVPAVRIDFSDTGSGVPPDILPRLFEPFVTDKKDGTGLGLSISYGIIQAHNGQISVASPPGQGATFTVRLPACPADQ